MTNLDNCQFYCLSFNNEQKKRDMIDRFRHLKIPCKFYDGVKHDDSRIKEKKLNNFNKSQWSATYGHLDMIRDFYNNSNKTYGIFCEDDIYIHRNIKLILHKVITDFNLLNLDILLLSYLLPYKIWQQHILTNYKLKHEMPKESMFKYHTYPDYLSGSQMYMITKNHAKFLLDNYYDPRIAKYELNYFMSDKIITKYSNGNSALIYPMLAIENSEQSDSYHQLCQKIHYDDVYI
jgi:GR25 family glycosyltransferase involved in LPS biosynthesis